MKNSLVIEFVGLAGVGKTTLCNKLLEKLTRNKIDCCKMIGTVPAKNRLSLEVFLHSLYITIKSKPKISKRLYTNLKNLYMSQMRIKYAKKKSGIHLSDQGVFQVLGTLRKYSKSKERIEFCNKKIVHLILPDILIFLKSDSKTICEQRYERDGVKELEDIEGGQKRELDLMKDVKYVSDCKEDFQYHVFFIKDNNSDSIVERIMEALDKRSIDRI